MIVNTGYPQSKGLLSYILEGLVPFDVLYPYFIYNIYSHINMLRHDWVL